jgi:hypothetical protein
MANEIELKPCPFCGGKAKLVKRKFKTGFIRVVELTMSIVGIA